MFDSVESVLGPLVGGAELVALTEDRHCQHHRLHLPFLRCSNDAEVLLVKAHGERVPLCLHHARDLRLRYDVSTPEMPREDQSYGHPAANDGLDLTWANPTPWDEGPIDAPVQPTFEETAFAGGTSGGGGGGADFSGPAVTDSVAFAALPTVADDVISATAGGVDVSSADTTSSDRSSDSTADTSAADTSSSSDSSSSDSSSDSSSSNSSSSSDYSSSDSSSSDSSSSDSGSSDSSGS